MNNVLIHHGILGQKWGVRRYQNPDGSLTPAGRKRLINDAYKTKYQDEAGKLSKNAIYKPTFEKYANQLKKDYQEVKNARQLLNQEYEKALNSKEFKDLERELSDLTYDKTGADEWAGSKDDYYKIVTNKNNIEYMWDEDEPEYYFRNDKRFKNYQKAKSDLDKAEIKFEKSLSPIREQLLNEIGDKKLTEIRTKENRMARMAIAEALRESIRTPIGTFKSDEMGNRAEAEIKNKVSNARKTGKYDMEFLEGGYDVNERTGELLQGKALDEAYEKYLRNK